MKCRGRSGGKGAGGEWLRLAAVNFEQINITQGQFGAFKCLWDGIDISKALRGGALPERAITWGLSAVSEIEFAVRRGNWKLLSDGNLQPMQLFNLAEDPLEFFNIIKENPLVLERLNKDLRESVMSFRNDPYRPDTKMKFRFAQ